MKFLAAAIVTLPLLLMGAPPALAQATGGGSTDRESYTKQAQDQVQEWKQKLHGVGDKAQTTGKGAGDATRKHLNSAWSKTQEASRKLQTAGGDGWEKAKVAYEKASRDLANTWHKIHPEE